MDDNDELVAPKYYCNEVVVVVAVVVVAAVAALLRSISSWLLGIQNGAESTLLSVLLTGTGASTDAFSCARADGWIQRGRRRRRRVS